MGIPVFWCVTFVMKSSFEWSETIHTATQPHFLQERHQRSVRSVYMRLSRTFRLRDFITGSYTILVSIWIPSFVKHTTEGRVSYDITRAWIGVEFCCYFTRSSQSRYCYTSNLNKTGSILMTQIWSKIKIAHHRKQCAAGIQVFWAVSCGSGRFEG
jgi:hypothetical protein